MRDPRLRRPHTQTDSEAYVITGIAGVACCILMAIAAAVLQQLLH